MEQPYFGWIYEVPKIAIPEKPSLIFAIRRLPQEIYLFFFWCLPLCIGIIQCFIRGRVSKQGAP